MTLWLSSMKSNFKKRYTGLGKSKLITGLKLAPDEYEQIKMLLILKFGSFDAAFEAYADESTDGTWDIREMKILYDEEVRRGYYAI